ncbi:MAG TPA: hypothetical protein VFQ12_02315 [Thermoleophilaceae bacterium]|nr:hypothetical protein [Thermoleophilaceae bacterium]
MTDETQLAWERRLAPLVAVAAFAAAVCVIVNQVVVQAVVLEDRPLIEPLPDFLLSLNEQPTAFVAASAVQALGYAFLGVVLWFVFRAARHRRPEMPGALIGLVYIGPLLFATGTLLGAIDRIDVADQFAAGGVIRGQAGEDRAEDLVGDISLAAPILLNVGGLATAILLVLVSVNAMRVGLFSRFIGILGIIVGALLVLPLFPGAPLVLQTFWLGALGVLLLGRWPGGRGPAWETGAADAWLTPRQRMALEQADPEPGGNGSEPEPPARRSSRKRKRKNR